MSSKIVNDREYMSHVLYASAIGSVMYTMMGMRLDLSQAISMIFRYMHDPDRGHGRL